MLFLLKIVLGFIHEISHAIAIIDAGGSVFEMGLAFNDLNPAFYVGITGQEKEADCLGRGDSDPDDYSRHGLCLSFLQISPLRGIFILMVINAVNMEMIFLNLLFLIKLDGYPILCELLEIKALKEKSITYVESRKINDLSQFNLLYFVLGWIYELYLPVLGPVKRGDRQYLVSVFLLLVH